VLVAKKDFYQAAHEEIPDVPNLEVLCLMKSMRSRELVRETFNWYVIVICVYNEL
jgi:small subunit ribosomal protein S10e